MNFDFSKLTASIQYLIIGIIVLMPIFYFDLYLYHKQFFNSSPYYVIIIAAYCLAFGFLMASIFLGLTFILYIIGEKNPTVEKVVGYGNGVAFVLILLSNLTTYTETGISTFKGFLWDLFAGYIIGLVVISQRVYARYRKRKKISQINIEFKE
jgi:hypothetical protein